VSKETKYVSIEEKLCNAYSIPLSSIEEIATDSGRCQFYKTRNLDRNLIFECIAKLSKEEFQVEDGFMWELICIVSEMRMPIGDYELWTATNEQMAEALLAVKGETK